MRGSRVAALAVIGALAAAGGILGASDPRESVRATRSPEEIQRRLTKAEKKRAKKARTRALVDGHDEEALTDSQGRDLTNAPAYRESDDGCDR